MTQNDDYEQTEMISENDDAAARETEDALMRAEEQAARDRRLGKVDRPTSTAVAEPAAPKRSTDKFSGALGLFLLRLVTATIMGVRGVQKLTDIPATEAFLSKVGLPQPFYFAWGLGVAEVLVAVALLFGLLTRIAGLGVAAIAIGSLTFVMWGAVNPIQEGVAGFIGELEVLLAAVGVLFLLLGGGRWSIDGSMRSRRAKAKAGY